ncbi:unnamed protein product [Ambrosiozyma monospora]|uniref:Unnamed protein product n=1 Tax=Ambrosiozyma monospora TaxID=43982 RepID=A0A9W6YR67_AMBMO|nr:unnamed protein product [Ambrosiozyma monospora]
MKVGLSGVVQSFKELIDKALPKSDRRYTELEDEINVALMKRDVNVLIKDLAILPSGTNLNVHVKLGVGSYNAAYENQLTLDKMGDIGKGLENQLKENFKSVKNVTVQFVSSEKKAEEKNNEVKEEGEKKSVEETKKADEEKK